MISANQVFLLKNRNKPFLSLLLQQTATSQKDGGEDCLPTLNSMAHLNSMAQRAAASTSMPRTTRGSCKTTVWQAETKHCIAYIYFVNKTTLLCWSRLTYFISLVRTPLWELAYLFHEDRSYFPNIRPHKTVANMCISTKSKGMTGHWLRPEVKSHWDKCQWLLPLC